MKKRNRSKGYAQRAKDRQRDQLKEVTSKLRKGNRTMSQDNKPIPLPAQSRRSGQQAQDKNLQERLAIYQESYHNKVAECQNLIRELQDIQRSTRQLQDSMQRKARRNVYLAWVAGLLTTAVLYLLFSALA